MTYLILLAGFVALIKGADWLVEGAASIAKKMKISDLVIGLTVVAFGTSAPELVVNLLASQSDKAGLAIGNIIGSNIANLLLVLGVTAMLKAVHVDRKLFKLEIPFAVLCVPILGFFATNLTLDSSNALISRPDSIVMIIAFAFFIYKSFTSGKVDTDEIPEETHPVWKAALYFFVGLTGLVLGGNWIVDSASELARNWGMSETMIGLTIVAIGTSLPEVAASIAAALKGNADMAIGNVLGSNIFNVLWVLALSGMIKPLPVNSENLIDFGVATIAGLLFVVVILVGAKDKKPEINKVGGVVFLLSYAGYIVYLINRG